MKNELRNCMRIGIVQFMAYPSTMAGSGPILESIDELVRDDFFDVVELTHIEDPSIRKEAAERIHTAGMQIAYGSQPLVLMKKLNPHSRDESLRKKSLDILLTGLEEAVEMGAVGFATMSGPDPGEKYRNDESKIFMESLGQICERARQLNLELRVAIESFDRVPFGKNCLTGPTNEAVELIKSVREQYPKFGFMLDLSHLPLLGETPEEAVPIAAPVLVHAHIGNCVMRDSGNPYYGDNHPPFGYGSGENGLDELIRYLRCLRDVGFLNAQNPPIVTAEVKPLNNSRIPATLGNIKRTMNRAIEKLEESNSR